MRLEKGNRRLQLELKGTNEQQQVQNRQVSTFCLPFLVVTFILFLCIEFRVPIKPPKPLFKYTKRQNMFTPGRGRLNPSLKV